MSENKKLAVVLIRGLINVHPDVKKTLDLLRIKKKHVCVVIDDNSINRGMLKKIKDYTTFGKIDESLFRKLLKERGELIGGKKAKDSDLDLEIISKDYFAGDVKLNEFVDKYSLKPYFRLHPPRGGFERKGIKMPYQKGGVLGNREENISELIIKML